MYLDIVVCDAKPNDLLPNKLREKHNDTKKESFPLSITIFLI